MSEREGGVSVVDLKNEAHGVLRLHQEYAVLRAELAAILPDFDAKQGTPGMEGDPPSGTTWENSYAPPETKRRSAFSIIGDVIIYTILAVFLAGAFVFSSPVGAAPRDIFGYSAMIMLTGSMQSEIPQDSLVVTKRTDSQTISLGDDISFFMRPGFIVTHRVIGIHEQHMDTGARGFETKGIENAQADSGIVPAANVIGIVVFHNETIGRIIILIRENLIITFAVSVLIVGSIFVMRGLISRKRAKNI